MIKSDLHRDIILKEYIKRYNVPRSYLRLDEEINILNAYIDLITHQNLNLSNREKDWITAVELEYTRLKIRNFLHDSD